MNKVNLTDVDVIDISQLWATHAQDIEETEAEKEEWNKKIMARMSKEAEDFYIGRMVPVVGRPYVKKEFENARKGIDKEQEKNARCQQFVIAYNEWLSKYSSQNNYESEHLAELLDQFYKLKISDFDYLQNFELIENKKTENLTRDEILTRLTLCVRGENFSDDFMVNHIKGGTIDKLLKCLDERTK